MEKKGSGFLGRNRRLRKKSQMARSTPEGQPQDTQPDTRQTTEDDEPFFESNYARSQSEAEIQAQYGKVVKDELEDDSKQQEVQLHDRRSGIPDRRKNDMDSTPNPHPVERRSGPTTRRKAKFMTVEELTEQKG